METKSAMFVISPIRSHWAEGGANWSLRGKMPKILSGVLCLFFWLFSGGSSDKKFPRARVAHPPHPAHNEPDPMKIFPSILRPALFLAAVIFSLMLGLTET